MNMTINRTEKRITKEEAWNRASFLCASSEKCLAEMKEKLFAWQISSEDSDAICQRLIDERFIDEHRYCLFYVKDKFRFNKWGRVKIRTMLQGKRIASKLIEDALGEIDETAYQELLNELLKGKLKGLKFKDDYDRQSKLIRFALSRGFEMNLVMDAVRHLDHNE